MITNQTAVDTWASAITDGVAQGTGTIIRLRRSANATVVQLRAAAGDTTDRFNVDLNGLLNWGPGNAAVDVTLARTGTAAATLTGALTVTGAATLTGGARTRFVPAMVRVTKTATQSIAAGSDVAVTFDSETFDTDTLHDNVTNNSRLTATVAGKYQVMGYLSRGNATTDGRWRGKIRKNGATMYAVFSQETAGVNLQDLIVNALVDLAATDYVELIANHSDSANITIGTISAFSMNYVGE